ncbi:Ig-like domain-containing protein [Mesobacillus foraminis]|uniref:Ig-like domain-containing protein n=1 Tax=Mesobacillus foraminis TaxID=279826 RepID=UPI000EF46AF5|nr:Ig-like domain-containing protein [Mesobacillus foraminis]
MRIIKSTLSLVVLIGFLFFSFSELTVDAASGDRHTPYSAFKKHKLSFQPDAWEQKRTIEVQLLEIQRGNSANEIVIEENLFNSVPKSDEEWILMKYNLKYVSGPEEELYADEIISSINSFFTPKGTSLSPETATFSGEREGYGEYDVSFYPGSESVVWYGILVKKSVGGYPLVRIPTSTHPETWTTSYAWLSTNPGYKEQVNITKINLNKASIRLGTGTSEKLTASIQPVNATNKAITWTSSNSKIAKVDSNGVIKALKAGSAKITAKTSNGKTAVSTVTVVPVISAKTTDHRAVKNQSIVNKNTTITITNNKIKSKTVTKSGTKYAWPSSGLFNKEGKYTITVKDYYNQTNSFTFTIDKKAPSAPTVQKITSKSAYVTGSAEKSSKVYIYRGSKVIAQGPASTQGKYKIKISKQKKGTQLKIQAIDQAGNKSKIRTTKVY